MWLSSSRRPEEFTDKKPLDENKERILIKDRLLLLRDEKVPRGSFKKMLDDYIDRRWRLADAREKLLGPIWEQSSPTLRQCRLVLLRCGLQEYDPDIYVPDSCLSRKEAVGEDVEDAALKMLFKLVHIKTFPLVPAARWCSGGLDVFKPYANFFTIVSNRIKQFSNRMQEDSRVGFAAILQYDCLASHDARLRLISFGRGSKCINVTKSELENERDSSKRVIDHHPEILARRGLLRYLYSELQKSEAEGSIFHRASTNGLKKLNNNISFHLYISKTPCGDAQVFSQTLPNQPQSQQRRPPSEDSEDVILRHRPIFTTEAGWCRHGLFQVKLSSGQITNPVDTRPELQTWSCSDKIAKWNILGIQGSLLSRLIEPIYLSTIQFGEKINHGHLTRALCCRVAQFEKEIFEAPAVYKVVQHEISVGVYRVNHPMIVPDPSATEAPVGQPISQQGGIYSFNWNCADGVWRDTTISGVEKLNQDSGYVTDGSASRLSKYKLYERFITVACPSDTSYYNSKSQGLIYNYLCERFDVYCGPDMQAFHRNGRWLHRNLKDFSLPPDALASLTSKNFAGVQGAKLNADPMRNVATSHSNREFYGNPQSGQHRGSQPSNDPQYGVGGSQPGGYGSAGSQPGGYGSSGPQSGGFGPGGSQHNVYGLGGPQPGAYGSGGTNQPQHPYQDEGTRYGKQQYDGLHGVGPQFDGVANSLGSSGAVRSRQGTLEQTSDDNRLLMQEKRQLIADQRQQTALQNYKLKLEIRKLEQDLTNAGINYNDLKRQPL